MSILKKNQCFQRFIEFLGIMFRECRIEELERAGERIFTMKRIFNAGHGLSRINDTLPERILNEPRGSGGSADSLPDLQAQLDEYYSYRGWTMDGLPTPEKLEELGLREFLNWLPK